MALKFEEVPTPSTKSLDDLKHKANLFEVLRVTSKPEFQWLQPFLWQKHREEPSALQYALAMVYAIGGSGEIERVLQSQAFCVVADYVENLQEGGGHPIDERAAIVLLRLASGAFYEDVLGDEKSLELLEIEAGKEKKAIERAKARVKRAKKRMTNLGLNVRHIDLTIKTFRQNLSFVAKKLQS